MRYDELFDPTDEHRMLREMVREFTANEVEPQAAAHDASGTLNVDLVRKMGELGLLGVTSYAELTPAHLCPAPMVTLPDTFSAFPFLQ